MLSELIGAACLLLIWLRGELWLGLGFVPLFTLQALKYVLGSIIAVEAHDQECGHVNKALSFVIIVVVAGLPVVWFLWATRCVAAQHRWTFKVLRELEDEIKDRMQDKRGEAGSDEGQVRQDAEDVDIEAAKQTGKSTELEGQVKMLTRWLERRQQMFAGALQALWKIYVMTFICYMIFVGSGIQGKWLDLCTRRTSSGGQVWPAFMGSNITRGYGANLGVFFSLVLTAMTLIPAFTYRGEYRTGIEYRMGWTCQASMGTAALAAPLMLWVYGYEALPLWCSAAAHCIVFLALEPYATMLIIKKLRTLDRSEKALEFFDERQASKKLRMTWLDLFDRGWFKESPSRPDTCSDHHACCSHGSPPSSSCPSHHVFPYQCDQKHQTV